MDDVVQFLDLIWEDDLVVLYEFAELPVSSLLVDIDMVDSCMSIVQGSWVFHPIEEHCQSLSLSLLETLWAEDVFLE